jgi:hypothetical protein
LEYVKDVHVYGYVQYPISWGPMPILPTQPGGDAEATILVIVLFG